MRWIAVFCVSAVCWYPGTLVAAHAADDVDVALVMVSDVSRSIDDSEYKLEKSGYASAFGSLSIHGQAIIETRIGHAVKENPCARYWLAQTIRCIHATSLRSKL